MIMFSLLVIVISLLTQHLVHSSPVLLWSNLKFPQTEIQLSTLSSEKIITNYVCGVNTEQLQIRIFAVDALTNEDIQRGSQSKHPLLLDAQKENSQYRYFPNVAGDVNKAFSLMPQSNNMYCSRIHIQITSSTTYETLHDALNAMKVAIDSIGTNSNTAIVAALISDSVVPQSSPRVRRDLDVHEGDVIVSDDRSCMFYAHSFIWEDSNESQTSSENYTLNYDDSACHTYTTVGTDTNSSSVILDLVWNNGTSEPVKMSLTANITGRYWYLEDVILNGSEYRYFAYGMHSRMDTPPAYSYVCTTAVFVKYNSSTRYGTYDFKNKFYLKNLQFQPFNGNGSYFGPPNYCTSFFTSGIWMGITSSLLCLGILLVGIHRMMSIKSNDRYDDPKGKPLIIKAQE